MVYNQPIKKPSTAWSITQNDLLSIAKTGGIVALVAFGTYAAEQMQSLDWGLYTPAVTVGLATLLKFLDRYRRNTA